MTEYTIDILQPNSFRRLPSAQEVINLNRLMSNNLLDHLSEIITPSSEENALLIRDYMKSIDTCLSLMGSAFPRKAKIPPLVYITYVDIEQRNTWGDNNFSQVFTIGNLDGVNHTLLIKVLSLLLENSLTWMKDEVLSASMWMVEEYSLKFEQYMSGLNSIFYKLIAVPRPRFTLARIKLELVDKEIEI
jgi:hypothetical protein